MNEIPNNSQLSSLNHKFRGELISDIKESDFEVHRAEL